MKEFNKDVVIQLRELKEKSQVEEIFKKYNITRLHDKQKYLEWAMYAPTTFFSGFTQPTEEGIYELTLEIFSLKQWKMHELYEKLHLLNDNVLLNKKEKELKEELLTCTTQSEVNSVFEKHNITTSLEKINKLRKFMNVGTVYDSGTTEEDFEFDSAVFLEGSWKNI